LTNRVDSFDRADTTTNIGTPSDAGSAWVELVGTTWGIISNQGYNSGASGDEICYLESSVADVDVQVTAVVAASVTGLYGRIADADNWLLMAFRPATNNNIYKNVAGSVTSIASFTGAVSNGDVLRLEMTSGDVITAYQNTVQRMQATDAAGSANTKHGLFANTDTSGRYDDFSITEIAAGGGDPEGSLLRGKLLRGGLLRGGVL
jgi:hypothetical protein